MNFCSMSMRKKWKKRKMHATNRFNPMTEMMNNCIITKRQMNSMCYCRNQITSIHGNDVISECIKIIIYSITSLTYRLANIHWIGFLWPMIILVCGLRNWAIFGILFYLIWFDLILFRIFLFHSDDLLADPTSFIYGQSPSAGNIPIYAKVTVCNPIEFDNEIDGTDDVRIECVVFRRIFD